MSERDEIRTLRRLLAVSGGAPDGGPPAEEIERAWRSLELPPVAPVPPGFAARVVARAAAERRPWLGWLGLGLAPAWARAAAAVALAAGIAGGVGLGWVAEEPPAATELTAQALPSWAGSTLAEEFVAAAGAGGETGSSSANGGEVTP